MAKKLKVGDVIRGYHITKVFGPGMMAISYGAISPTGGASFLQTVQIAGADGSLVRFVCRISARACRHG